LSESLKWLFATQDFIPHGHCYLWQPATLWLNVGSDGLIAAAYFAIPVSLYSFVRDRKTEIPFPGIFLMFAAFILLCGTTHVMEIWTVWNPAYRLSGTLKLITGIVSFATTIALVRLVPLALQLRSPQALQREVELRTAELGQANATLEHTVAELRRAETALREANARKDVFLATLSHELRNPLSPIRNAAALLARPALSADDHERSRLIIVRQVRHMASLLDDLLDMSRITRGVFALKKELVNLQSLLAEALETARPLIDQKRHTLELEWPAEPVEVEVDPIRFVQIASNLLTNAAKYTDPEGVITFGVRLTSGTDITLFVRDTGIGLAPEMREEVFEMFSQVAQEQKRSEGGLGIGLALVKGLVELHGGRIEARSEGLERGSEFTVFLPGVRTAPVSSPLAPHQPSNRAPLSSSKRVLIADDNQDGAESLGMLIELAGHQVCIVHTGIDALQMARTYRPHVAILDIGMPGMDGYEVAQQIRDQPWGTHMILIALTGWGQEDDKLRARRAGFDHHFTKPMDPTALDELLQ
jgi:signal transduction histidine kinase/CheY-like chemotaxis protein